MPSTRERLGELGISHLYTAAGRVYAGDPSAGLYGSAPVPEVLAALDAAEEVEGELEERFRVFHSLVTFEEELEGNGVGKGHYLPQGREG
jgi:hypothetical protein